MRSRLAALALLGVTAMWGSTFIMIKDLNERLPVPDFLAVRFAIAALALFLVAPGAIARLSPLVRRRSVYAGVIYALAQLLQTHGLSHTDASVSGFVTGMYVVATPLLAAALLRQRIEKVIWLAVALSTAGLAFLSLRGLSIGYGEAITLLAALLYAGHIVALSRWSTTADALGMATIQTAVISVVCLTLAAPGGVQFAGNGTDWLAVVYMALAAGALAMLAQTWAQSQLSAARAALLMTMEPVFAAAFAVAFGGEQLGLRVLIGGSFILAGMIIAENSGDRATTSTCD